MIYFFSFTFFFFLSMPLRSKLLSSKVYMIPQKQETEELIIKDTFIIAVSKGTQNTPTLVTEPKRT